MKKLETIKSIVTFIGMTLLFLTHTPVLEGNKPAVVIAFILLGSVLAYYFVTAVINIRDHIKGNAEKNGL